MTIQEARRPTYQVRITGGEFAPAGIHRGWTGSIQTSNIVTFWMSSGMVTPSTFDAGIVGALTFTTPTDRIMNGGGSLSGYEDVCGSYVYSGTLAFDDHGDTVLACAVDIGIARY